MRAREFIAEGESRGIQPDVAAALPATYVIPALKNQDPYRQYRFGVAIAAAKGQLDNNYSPVNNIPPYSPTSIWGENEVVVSYGADADTYIDAALKAIGLSPSDKKLISTKTSIEGPGVGIVSPVKPFKGYPR